MKSLVESIIGNLIVKLIFAFHINPGYHVSSIQVNTAAFSCRKLVLVSHWFLIEIFLECENSGNRDAFATRPIGCVTLNVANVILGVHLKCEKEVNCEVSY